MRKFFLHRCTFTVLAINYCSRIFFKSLSYLYAVVHTNFSDNFLDFRNFDKNENYVVYLKEQSILAKTLKTASKSGNKRQRNACSNYAPLKRTVLRTRSVTNKK